MNKREAIESFVSTRVSSIPTEWVRIVSEAKALEMEISHTISHVGYYVVS